jgi:anti-anti-sigma factor
VLALVVNEELDWDLEVRTTGGRAEIQLTGELDLETAPSLVAAFEGLLDDRPPKITMDLTRLMFVDSSGLGALVACWRRAQQAGTALTITNPQEDVSLSLEITGLNQILPIQKVADAA